MDFCVRKQHQTLDRRTRRRPPSICSDLSPQVLLVVLSAGLLRGTQGTFPGAGLTAAVLWGQPSCVMMGSGSGQKGAGSRGARTRLPFHLIAHLYQTAGS